MSTTSSNVIEFYINDQNKDDQNKEKNLKLLLLDFDHTICKPKTDHINKIGKLLKNGRTFPVDENDWMWLRPNIPIRVIIGFGKSTDLNVIRKPNPLLFTEEFDKETSLFVGDAAGRPADFSDSDKEFAKNIGMKFCIPEDIFPI
jgi:DNA 3'-phosphatase